MKKSILILSSVISLVLLTACSSNYEVKEINGLYSMKILDFMTSSTVLNDDASLQYNYLASEKYIIVIDENKQEFIDALKEIEEYNDDKSVVDNYSSIQLEFFSEAGTIRKQSDLKSLKINGMDARMIAVDAEIEGIPEPISYWLGYVEGKENMYTIMAWTLESKKDSFEAEANEMMKSLKEL